MEVIDKDKLRTVLVTDCGSTTTKAVLFEKLPAGWRQTYRGEAPTTVEAPIEDVTVGALNAFKELEELSSRKIVSDEEEGIPFLFRGEREREGIDLYLSTSSAGGGLQMV
ncbi:MAG: methylaspartate mutase, partial [Candidatus Dadabacteria bacterium]